MRCYWKFLAFSYGLMISGVFSCKSSVTPLIARGDIKRVKDQNRKGDPFLEFYTERTFDIKPIWKFYTRRCNSCPRIYIPVCGTDNLTYTNECKLRCSNNEMMKDPPVLITRRGMCRPLL